MKVYQPTVLNTLAPYAGPQGFGMNRFTGQTIAQQTTAGSNQIDPLPFRGYSVPAPSLAYYGLSEMNAKGLSGVPRMIIRQASKLTNLPPSLNPQRIQQAAPMLPPPPGTDTAGTTTTPGTAPQTPSAPGGSILPTTGFFSKPLNLALVAAGVFLVAKQFKIV